MLILLVLVVLALLFGAGAVIEGVAWAFLITLALIAAAAWYGWSNVRGATQRR